jgi:hypothetical protein
MSTQPTELITCDAPGCGKAYHAECVKVDINTLPLAWFCPDCSKHPADKSTTPVTVLDDEITTTRTNAISIPALDFEETAPRTPTKPSRPVNKFSNRDRIIRPSTSSSDKPSSTPSTFRLVTVPKGVNPGEEFHVIISSDTEDNTDKDVVIGVICPRGVREGDSIVVLEPGHIHPLISPEEVVKINRRLFARDNGCGGIDEGPRIPSQVEEKDRSLSLLDMMDSAIADVFWELLWPFLRSQGWSCDRQVHFNFGAVKFRPPTPIREASIVSAAETTKDALNYFHSLRGIRTHISGDIKYAQALHNFDAAVVRRKKAVMSRCNKQQQHRSPRTPDEWKGLRNRKYIRLGKEFQVTQAIPRVGTNVPGEEARYM